MKRHKGQITIFLLLATLVVLGGGLFFLYPTSKEGAYEQETEWKAPVDIYLKNCLAQSLKESVVKLGRKGGYENVPSPRIEHGASPIPFYFFEEISYRLSRSQLEKELSRSISKNISTCLQNSALEQQGFLLEEHPLISSVISNESIFASMRIGVSQGKIKGESVVSATLPSLPLGKIHDASLRIIELHEQNPASICISCLFGLGEQNNLSISITEYGNSTLVYTITAYNLPFADSYNFTFAIWHPAASCKNLKYVTDTFLLQRCIEEQMEEEGGANAE